MNLDFYISLTQLDGLALKAICESRLGLFQIRLARCRHLQLFYQHRRHPLLICPYLVLYLLFNELLINLPLSQLLFNLGRALLNALIILIILPILLVLIHERHQGQIVLKVLLFIRDPHFTLPRSPSFQVARIYSMAGV